MIIWIIMERITSKSSKPNLIYSQNASATIIIASIHFLHRFPNTAPFESKGLNAMEILNYLKYCLKDK